METREVCRARIYLPSKLGRNIEYAEQKVEVMDICYAVKNDVVHCKTIEHVDW